MGSQKSEILPFEGFGLSNSYKVSAKKVHKLSLMTLKSDGKFKEKLTCDFKYDIRNLVNFHPTTQKSFLLALFVRNYTRFELQKHRGVNFYDTEQLCTI